MIIQIDSREKARAIKKIVSEFDRRGIKRHVSKLYVGDYMNYDNPRLIVDRKQNLTELCSNVCQDHERFRRELVKAKEAGIKLIILCEHGDDIQSLEDVIFWKNPRSEKRVRNAYGKWETVHTKATTGETLYRILSTISRKYDVDFEFCTKDETGRRIVEILNDEGRNLTDGYND